jgi:hypothetical protein
LENVREEGLEPHLLQKGIADLACGHGGFRASVARIQQIPSPMDLAYG